MLQEFKKFILRGNVLDLAVAVIIGAAFGAVITAFTNGILMNLIAAIFGQPSFDSIVIDVGDGELLIGVFLTAVVNFLIIAFALFLIIKTFEQMENRRRSGTSPGGGHPGTERRGPAPGGDPRPAARPGPGPAPESDRRRGGPVEGPPWCGDMKRWRRPGWRACDPGPSRPRRRARPSGWRRSSPRSTWDGEPRLVPAIWYLLAIAGVAWSGGSSGACAASGAGGAARLPLPTPTHTLRVSRAEQLPGSSPSPPAPSSVCLLLDRVRRASAGPSHAADESNGTLARLDSLFANAPVGLAFLDLELRFVRVNEALASIAGRPVADHLGRTLDEVVGPDGRRRRWCGGSATPASPSWGWRCGSPARRGRAVRPGSWPASTRCRPPTGRWPASGSSSGT